MTVASSFCLRALCATLCLASTAALAQPGTVDFTTCSAPVYPPAASARNAQGTTYMAFLIGPDGAVRATRLERSSGHADLDDAARGALASCRFRPARLKDKAVEAWTLVAYEWTLDAAGKAPEAKQ